MTKLYESGTLILLMRWTGKNEPSYEKTNILVSDIVQYKPGCTATEDG